MSAAAPADRHVRQFYLGAGEDAALLSWHAPPSDVRRPTAVLICPPFGWEEVSCYRCLRQWALELAARGFGTLRLQLPSTGDAGGGVRDPARVAAWVRAVAAAARWLRAAHGAARVTAIGMGLGGVLCHAAAAGGAPLEDLVLWGVPARGRSLIRELRAFSALETAQFFAGLTAPPPPPDGALEAGGFCLTGETISDLQALDLAELPLPAGQRRRALLLQRDGIGVDERLRARLVSDGVAVRVEAGPGYGAMSSHPQRATPASGTFATVAAWLEEGERSGTAGAAQPAAGEVKRGAEDATARDELAGGNDGGRWRERPLWLHRPGGLLAAVLTQPVRTHGDGTCALLLNAGAVRRIGPSRMWVQTARRWAQLGVPTLRLDVTGIGDADGPVAPYAHDGALYDERLLAEVLAVLDELERSGTGRRFLLAGLCAGAYWALHALLQDVRVCAAVMLNPRALAWDEDLAPARHVRKLLTERPSPAHIRRVATPRMALEAAAWLVRSAWRRTATAAGRSGAAGETASELVLRRLVSCGRPATLVFSEGEPLADELAARGGLSALERSPNVVLERIPVRDHTLRPGSAQRAAQEAMDRALKDALGLPVAADRAARSPSAT
ncbi:MAG TPA: hypothetical protein VKV27_14665 [Solirubrobacteraceae bacterium]|nr:hypothetical protein [Solirubrobacteraceae bacterium]